MNDRPAGMFATPVAATDASLPAPGGPADERVRRCIVGGTAKPRAQMIRYVVRTDPEPAAVVPDIEARLPGRGLWTEARRDIVVSAVARRSFAKAAGMAVQAPANLDAIVEALLLRRVLDLVGVARRARLVQSGFDPVCEAVTRGNVGVLLVASDASPSARTRLGALAAAAQTSIVAVLTADELGQVFARPRAAQVSISRGRMADRIIAECARLGGFRGGESKATIGLESEGQ